MDKKRIISIVQEKLVSNFKKSFLPKSIFSSEYSRIKTEFDAILNAYVELVINKAAEIIDFSITKNERSYIAQNADYSVRSKYFGYYNYDDNILSCRKFFEEQPESYNDILNTYRASLTAADVSERHIDYKPFMNYLPLEWRKMFPDVPVSPDPAMMDPDIEVLFHQFYQEKVRGNREHYYYSDRAKSIMEDFLSQYGRENGMYADCLDNAKKYLQSEEIDPRDSIIVNVGTRSWRKPVYRVIDVFEVINGGVSYVFEKFHDAKGLAKTIYADVIIITNRDFIRLSVGHQGLIERTQYKLRSMKKPEVAEDHLLKIFFHGFSDPETIVMDSYEDALQLQRKLLG